MASTLTTIRARLVKLQRQAAKLERAASKRIKAASKVIAKYRLTASDLTEALKLSGGGRASGRRNPLAGRSVAVKYRDSAGNTWTGRGHPPLWLVAAEKAGKTRDSFLIGAKKSAKPAKARIKTKTAKPKPKVKAKKAARPKAKAKSKRPAKAIAAPAPAASAT